MERICSCRSGFFDRAFRQLQGRLANLHLAVAGPRRLPPPRGENVHDLGILPLDAVPKLYNALDVAVVCNRDNAFGRYCHPQKAVEIMACDIPLVAARVGSMAQFFRAHPDWLFEAEDPTALAAAVAARIDNPATVYPAVPTWDDQAVKLDRLLAALPRQR